MLVPLTPLSLPSDTLFSLRKLVQALPWDQVRAPAQAAWTALFGGQSTKQRRQGGLKWQSVLSLALCLCLLSMLIHASVSSVETRRTGTVSFDIHLNPNSGPSGTLPVIIHGVIYTPAFDLRPGSHSNSAGVASFDPAVDDSSGTEACQANNLAQGGISSFINTMKLIDVSKFRTQLQIRLTTAEQVAKLRLCPPY